MERHLGGPKLSQEKDWDFCSPHPLFWYKSSHLTKEERSTQLAHFDKNAFRELLEINFKSPLCGVLHSRSDIWQSVPSDFTVFSIGNPPPSLFKAFQNRLGVLQIFDWDNNVDHLPQLHDPSKLLIYFSNPANFVGSFMPSEVFASFLENLLERYPNAHILIDESSTFLSFENIPVGSTRDDASAEMRHQVTTLLSSYPMYLPQDDEVILLFGKEIPWLKQKSLNDQTPDGTWIAFERILRQFLFQDQGFVANVQNILLNLDFVLKNWALALHPFQDLGLIKMKAWPLAGYFFSFDVEPWIGRNKMKDAQELSKWIYGREYIRFIAGNHWGAPHQLGVCFAHMPNHILPGLKRFKPENFVTR